MKKIIVFTSLLLFAVSGMVFAGGQQEGGSGEEVTKVIMADASWDSILVHNRIVEFILEKGYGNYEVDFVPGDTIPLFNGLVSGDIDVNMESWHENFIDVYTEAIDAGTVVNVGDNMPKAPQGWYIPRYMVEGDSERGIDAVAPDLKSIADLPKYKELFPDPENPGMGQIIIGPPGWSAPITSEKIMEESGLTKDFNGVMPGSGTALAATMVGAYQAGKPYVGYYWEPTAVMGRLDMIMLEGSEFPPTSVDILVNKETYETMPELIAFLEKYSTTLAQNNKTLGAMEENDLDSEGAAKWFLQNFEEVWTGWVDADVAERVKAAL
jgi:glycine betaine/proline transport system substrate-binding protein